MDGKKIDGSKRYSYENSGPSKGSFVITPSDDEDLPQVARAITINVAGNVRMTQPDGSIVTRNLEIGTSPYSAIKIWETGTDAAVINGGILGEV